MTPLTTPSSAHPPLMELALWLLRCKSYQGLVHEQVDLNRKRLRDGAGHCYRCCFYDENGVEVEHNDNCMGCRGTTSVEVQVNETGRWLEEYISCDHCDQDGDNAYEEGTLVNAAYYARKAIQESAAPALRVMKSREHRDELREHLRDWADLQDDRTLDTVGKICGLAWAAGESGSVIHSALEELLESWSETEKDTFQYGFSWHIEEDLDWAFLDDLRQLPNSTQQGFEEELDELEIQDFWIIRKEPVSPPKIRPAERVSMTVWFPKGPKPADHANQAPGKALPESREERLRRSSNSLREALGLDPKPEDHDFSEEARDRRLMALIRSADEQEDPGGEEEN